jgi:tetratricopeptide (TPR) repeat protein
MREYLIALASLSAITVAVQFLPLMGRIEFEFAAVSGLVVTLGSGIISVMRVRQKLACAGTTALTPGEALVPIVADSLLYALPVFALPLIIALIRSLFVGVCDLREGITFYLLIPGVSLIYGVCVGSFFGLLAGSTLRGCLMFLGYVAFTIVWAGYLLIFQPQTFVYSSAFGFFPGPIYDERISITGTLVIARVITLVISGLFFTLSLNLLNPETMRFGFGRLVGGSTDLRVVLNRIWLAAFAVAYLLLFALGPRLGVRSTRSFIRRKLGGVYETEHFRIYYPIGSKAEREIELIARDHEFRYHQLSRFLKVETSKKMGSYIYLSPDVKKRMMGARFTSVEDPVGYEMHLNYSAFPHPVLKHEMAHLLSANFHPILRMSIKIGLHEGLAVAADWDEERLTPHQWAKAMQVLGVMPSMKRLMGAIGFWTESASRAYMAAGSFVRFLIERYGIERFKTAFPTGNFEKVYGRKVDDLIFEWRGFLEGITLSEEDISYAKNALVTPPITRRRCPHEIAEILDEAWRRFGERDYRGAAEGFRKAWNLNRSDPNPLHPLALCLFRMKRYSEAKGIAQRILDHPNATPVLLAKAKELIGDICWLEGKGNEAAFFYRSALKVHPPKSMARGLKIKLVALKTRDDGGLVMDALISDSGMSAKVADLSEALRVEEIKEIALYLLGRWLLLSDEFRRSLRYLELLTASGHLSRLPDDDFRYETFRLKGIALYRLDRIEEAAKAFERMRIFASCQAEVYRAQDWIERCRWEENVRSDQRG